MSHAQSNRIFTHPRNEHLKIPETVSEFLEMDYLSRLQLFQEHPKTYRRLANRADRRGKAVWEE